MDSRKVSIFGQLLCLYVCHSFGGLHPNGMSEVSRSQDSQGNYQFDYKVVDQQGEQYRREGTDPSGAVVGSYGFTEADGRRRVVDYIADEHGFRAHVRTNEPGITDASPAAVVIAKEGHRGSSTHLDFAETSVSSASSRNLRKEQPERIFGVRLTPILNHQRHLSDLDTTYTRNRPPSYPSDGISTLRGPKWIPPYPSTSSRDLNAYYPPLDPLPPSTDFHEYQQRRILVQSSPSQPPSPVTDSSVPFLPPYGGRHESMFIHNSVNRNDVKRRPDVSMTAIHGGYVRDPFVSSPARQYYGDPRVGNKVRSRPDYSSVQDDRILVPTLNDIVIPSTNTNIPNLVLRAVAIPNGIQAVHVDPSTGEIHKKVVYPTFDKQGKNYIDYKRDARRNNYFPNTDYSHYDLGGYMGYEPSPYQDTDDVRHIPGTVRRFSSNNLDYFNRPVYAEADILRNRQAVTTPKDFNLSSPSAKDLVGLPPQFRYGADFVSYPHGKDVNHSLNVLHRSSTWNNKYPSYHVIPDVYHPGYTNQPDFHSNTKSFNPYSGALPSSSRVRTYPNYNGAGLFTPEYYRKEDNTKALKTRSSVEFVQDDSKTDEPPSSKSH